ncbi:MAG: aminoglycoside phosphotransferase family protein [Planctomycetaceae bacterium]
MHATTDLDDLAERARSVLASAGVPAAFRLEPITGGGNNRVVRVDSAAGPVVLKAYFRHPDDPRDRLRADFGFSSFAWQVGARALPRPLASDSAAGMAVYEFVAGRKLAPGEVTEAHVAEAASFFRAVNEHRSDPGAADLPEASEACFSIAAHVACVDRRVARLGGIDAASPLGREAAELVARRIAPAWQRVRDVVLASAGTSADEPLAAGDRCLSPSDFGFHNAILASDARLRFLDFEYAGHDDPAKMACDFFCQPAVPVPREHLPVFVASLAGLWESPSAFRGRVELLLPVYELKWCCIMLNEFLPADGRRAFAGAGADREARRAAQLAKVVAALDRMDA